MVGGRLISNPSFWFLKVLKTTMKTRWLVKVISGLRYKPGTSRLWGPLDTHVTSSSSPEPQQFKLFNLFLFLKMNLVPTSYSRSSPSLLVVSCILGLDVLLQCFSSFLRILPSHFGILQFLVLYFFYVEYFSDFCVSNFALCSQFEEFS